ncbi:MAG: hypothetical protein ACJ74Y_02105 [Bryobacteraceae bacterium]
MNKTIHVQRRENQTFEVHVESAASGERKVSGRFLDANRLEDELTKHGCTPDQIKQGLGELKDQQKQSARISVED